MMQNIDDVRLKRTEQDIETLRTTQTALLDRYDRIFQTLVPRRATSPPTIGSGWSVSKIGWNWWSKSCSKTATSYVRTATYY